MNTFIGVLEGRRAVRQRTRKAAYLPEYLHRSVEPLGRRRRNKGQGSTSRVDGPGTFGDLLRTYAPTHF